MSNNYFVEPSEGELILAHHGIMGQKWGIRKYQNPDGTLTEAGKRRYGTVQNFNKIQNARVDAEAYKIRAKAEAKVAKKQQKIEDKRNAKLEKERQKEEDKRNLKMSKEMQKLQYKQAKKQAKLEEKYSKQSLKELPKNDKKDGKMKKLAGEMANDVLIPVAKNAARDMLSNFVNKKVSEIGMTEADKKYARDMANLRRNLETVSLKNAYAMAAMDNEYISKAATRKYDAVDADNAEKFKRAWTSSRGGVTYTGRYDYYTRR